MNTVDKIPLILLPGLLCSPDLWAHQVENLADIADITVADMTRADSMAGMAEGILAGAPPQFALAGLSMGGYVAHEIMVTAPERVSRLALLDTSARADRPGQSSRRKELIELAHKGEFKGITDRLLPLFLHPDRLDDEDLTGRVKSMAGAVGLDAFLRQQKAIAGRVDRRADLARVDCPTLVLCGRDDILTRLAAHEEMATAIAGAKLVVIEDCGHLSTMERPDAVTAAMRDWLLGD